MSTPKNSSLLISLSLSLLFTFFNLALSDCNPNDKKVLLQITTHFNNPSSLSSWNPNTDCSFWEDIGTDEQGHVTRLRINPATDIIGPIPDFLDRLPFVSTLDLSGLPNLFGPIPSSIGNMNRLTQLYISQTNVSGPIPGSFGRLSSLTTLDLSGNGLTGPIPPALAQLTRLEYLRLSSNKLSGPIPDSLGRRLKNLFFIGLDSNRLSGPIPGSLSLLPTLTTIDFSKNRFTGPLPNPLGRPNVLSNADLGYNKITGYGSFLFDKNYTNLSFLYINNNLFKFDFSNVDLTPTLVIFNISHNMIYGSLPKRFGQMKPDPNYVDVSYNQLCGPIPNGRRFKQANPSIFAHNKCLCGGPLPACK